MVKWKKLSKKMAGFMLGVMMLLTASTTAFAYVDESAEASKQETVQTETEAETPTGEEALPENDKTEKSDGAFSTPGNGEVKDDITDDSSKEFLTITTKNNNTFYIVIDRSTTSQNVHMLSQIDENDLKEFLDKEDTSAVETPTPSVVLDEKEITAEGDKETTAEPEKEATPKTNVGAIAAILVLALGGIAGYYYFKIYKPKKDAEENFEEEGLETSDGLETMNDDEEENEEE